MTSKRSAPKMSCIVWALLFALDVEPPGGVEPPAVRLEAGGSSAELRRRLEEGLGFEPRRARSPGCFRDSCHQPDSANPPIRGARWGDRSESNRHRSGHNRAL